MAIVYLTMIVSRRVGGVPFMLKTMYGPMFEHRVTVMLNTCILAVKHKMDMSVTKRPPGQSLNDDIEM